MAAAYCAIVNRIWRNTLALLRPRAVSDDGLKIVACGADKEDVASAA
jgi:hypothetical protein